MDPVCLKTDVDRQNEYWDGDLVTEEGSQKGWDSEKSEFKLSVIVAEIKRSPRRLEHGASRTHRKAFQ